MRPYSRESIPSDTPSTIRMSSRLWCTPCAYIRLHQSKHALEIGIKWVNLGQPTKITWSFCWCSALWAWLGDDFDSYFGCFVPSCLSRSLEKKHELNCWIDEASQQDIFHLLPDQRHIDTIQNRYSHSHPSDNHRYDSPASISCRIHTETCDKKKSKLVIGLRHW